ncbi:DUF2958 domain-containing protein [Reyranella massiliensis]|uniref:DUF2958 domain-containing protein n=1 Tax=Reyranella massiliensis TaxID=445220 RepID=UPI000304A79C|nr:DUF2958 domain-containing protein [Reyranella massiliensis]
MATGLLTPTQIVRLKNNGEFNRLRMERTGTRIEFQPVVRVRASDGREWLLFEIDPANHDMVLAEARRRGQVPERLWLHLSWLERRAARTMRFGRVQRIAA